MLLELVVDVELVVLEVFALVAVHVDDYVFVLVTWMSILTARCRYGSVCAGG